MKSFIPLYFFGLVSADITAVLFSDGTCGASGGSALVEVTGNSSPTPNCINLGEFQSVDISSITHGFGCKIYSDNGCSNLIATLDDGSSTCTGVIGNSAQCLNILATTTTNSTAEITIGKSSVPISLSPDVPTLLQAAIRNACSDNGCDPETKQTDTYDNSECVDPRNCDRIICTQSVSVSANFDNSDERDYMSALLQKTMSTGVVGLKATRDNKSISSVMSFAQVELNDPSGNNQAEMTVSIELQCQDVQPSGFDCGGAEGSLTAAALGAIPEVGAVLALGFVFACEGITNNGV